MHASVCCVFFLRDVRSSYLLVAKTASCMAHSFVGYHIIVDVFVVVLAAVCLLFTVSVLGRILFFTRAQMPCAYPPEALVCFQYIYGKQRHQRGCVQMPVNKSRVTCRFNTASYHLTKLPTTSTKPSIYRNAQQQLQVVVVRQYRRKLIAEPWRRPYGCIWNV